jgi:hypothetical protein
MRVPLAQGLQKSPRRWASLMLRKSCDPGVELRCLRGRRLALGSKAEPRSGSIAI